MKNILIAFIFSILSNLVFADSGKKEYNEYFVQGNYLMLEQNYSLALLYYKKAYQIDSTNANINYKIGCCYLESNTEKYKALRHLEKAIKDVTHNYDPEDPNEKKASDLAYYYLGIAYRLAYRFDVSNTYFEKFKDIVGKKNDDLIADIKNQITTNYNAIEYTKDTAIVKIINLGDSINSQYPDYGAVTSADESTLLFTSRRPENTGSEKSLNNQYLEDIYIAYKKSDGSWSTAKSIGPNINTEDSEAIISLSANGQDLYAYRDVNGGDIYYSHLEGDTWSPLIPLSSNINTPAWETHATLSSDGSTIYFVSDRKEGSFGGRDIWRCVKLPNGLWSMPTNLGPEINTAFDEEAPFIHPDGVTLFFSSKGHKNMGGFDIFKTVKDENEKWSTPENLKSPINTPDDDIFYVQSADGKKGYYSSIRKGGFGEKDVYTILFQNTMTEPLTLLKGAITLNGSTKDLSKVTIIAQDIESGLYVQQIKPNAISGKYLLILASGKTDKNYAISYEAEGFQPALINISVPANSAYQEIEKELLLHPMNLESKTLGTISIAGTIKNKNGNPIPGALINVKDNLTGQLINTYYTSSDSGSYFFVLNRGQNYNISYEAKNYLFQSENVNVPKQPAYSVLTKNIVLEKVQIGSKIVLNNIFFDSNKATLRKESNIELSKLVEFMNEYPEINVEVAGHTDSKGNDAANLKLSTQRAESVVKALIKKGVKADRLIAKGYGETAPIAPNTLPNGKPDTKGMQLNRRVEMKITEPK